MLIRWPPLIQSRYLKEKYFESRTIDGAFYKSCWHFEGNMYYQIELAPWTQLEGMLSKGVPTATIKQWLFYMQPVI